MYHTCSSFIIPGNITAKYLVVITNSNPSQKPLAEIHKWKCSLISFANGIVAAHMSYQHALFWVGIQCPGPSQQKLLSSAFLLGNNGKCHCPHCLIRTSYFAFCFLQPTCWKDWGKGESLGSYKTHTHTLRALAGCFLLVENATALGHSFLSAQHR
jgi:hypothetical protein